MERIGLAPRAIDSGITPHAPLHEIAIRTRAANERVVAEATAQRVVTIATIERVVTTITIERVVACQTQQIISALATPQRIRLAGSLNRIVTCGAGRDQRDGCGADQIGMTNHAAIVKLILLNIARQPIADRDAVTGAIGHTQVMAAVHALILAELQAGRIDAGAEYDAVVALGIRDHIRSIPQRKHIRIIPRFAPQNVIAQTAA